MNSTINGLFACAMVERCSLAEAARRIGAPHDDLVDAYRFRLDTATGGYDGRGKWYDDYFESITESFKRLQVMN